VDLEIRTLAGESDHLRDSAAAVSERYQVSDERRFTAPGAFLNNPIAEHDAACERRHHTSDPSPNSAGTQ
jgi:hypothetical protein